jgi:hypothetical protein
LEKLKKLLVLNKNLKMPVTKKQKVKDLLIMASDIFYKNEIIESLEDYQNWIEKEIPIDDSWDPEVSYLENVRSEIHRQISLIQNINIDADLEKLRLLDKKWQAWAINNTDKEYNYCRSSPPPPRSHWWHWIDKIEELTPEERSTI